MFQVHILNIFSSCFGLTTHCCFAICFTAITALSSVAHLQYYLSVGFVVSVGYSGYSFLFSLSKDYFNPSECLLQVTSVSYHPKDDAMITSSVDGTIRVWKT